MAAFHVPASANADFYPLQTLRNILFGGQSSRIYQRLVDKDQLAVSVDGSLNLALDPTLFVIVAQARAGVDTLAIEKALYEELERLKTGGVSEQELRKAKNNLLAEFYRQLKTINGKSRELGNYEVYFGSYQKMFGAADEFNKVTRDEVRNVARKYFTNKNRTVGTLVLEKTGAVATEETWKQ
jgi:zinc protease